jgi:exonuclease SbcD
MHQDLGAKTGMPVVYAGSLERVDFSEEKHDKGFVWIEFDHGDVRWEFIEIDARPYKTLYVDVSGIERGLTQNILKQVRKKDWTDAVARIVVTVNETDQHKIYRQDIEEALIKAGAYYVHSVSLDVIREGREVRLDANKPIQSYTEEELLETYFLGTGMKPGKKLDRLINMAFDIMDEVDSGK